jgi:hypothetical protein
MTTIKIKKTEYLVTEKTIEGYVVIHALTKNGNLKKFGAKSIKRYEHTEGEYELLGKDAAGRYTYNRVHESEIDFRVSSIH